jgi:signal transduction histidine kinase
MFYGALIVMALFNLGVYALIRQSEYLIFTLLLAALGLVQFTLAGHTSQYLFEEAPQLANRTLPVAIALVIVLIPAFGATSFRQFEQFQRQGRIAQRCIAPASVLLLFVCVAPPGIGLRTSVAGAILLTAVAPLLLIPLIRRKNEQLGLYLRSWYCLVIAVPIHALRSANIIPPIPLTDFSVQIGIALYGVMTSLALAKRLQVARDQLGRLNFQLSANVNELKLALIHAEQATEAATQATLAKDQFMATMSHELRTPLNAIINVPQGLLEDFPELPAAECAACGARFLLDEGESVAPGARCSDCQSSGTLHETVTVKYLGAPAHTARFLRKIERSGKHLLQMVNGVLDFSKIQAQRLELVRAEIDVDALLRETLDELSELAAQRKLSLKLAHSGTPFPLWADPLRIKQVLLNLLSNAIKFSEPEGTIVVRWECRRDADVISVQDQGIGIAPEHQSRIFHSFEQVHKGDTRKYGGTGLGLSISRSLVELHGGEIWVESAEGKGSTFSFSIPRTG